MKDTNMKIQLLNGTSGKPEFVVLSVEEFNRLASGQVEIDEDGEVWESIPVEAGELDNKPTAAQPHDVVEIIITQNVSNAAAWRIYRGMMQSEAAKQAGMTQAAISQIEKRTSHPQEKTRQTLAKIYQCHPDQLRN